MPCNDVTEQIQVVLDSQERLQSYHFAKRTCGQPIGSDSMLLEQLSGRALDELLYKTAGEYLDYEPSTSRFSLPEEHAEVLTKPDSPTAAIGILGWIPSFSAVLPRLMDAFKNGGGVPYGD